MYYARDLRFNTKRSVGALAKTEVLEWGAFIRGDVTPLNVQNDLISKSVSLASFLLMIPQRAFAATSGGSWDTIFDKLLELADYADGGIIIFSGATMMFGNRTKAIELLFGSSLGYLIIRHWEDINRFLKGI